MRKKTVSTLIRCAACVLVWRATAQSESQIGEDVNLAKVVARGTISEFTEILDDNAHQIDWRHLYDDKVALIHLAVMNKENPEILQRIIDIGADIHIRDYRGRDAILVAIDEDNAAAVRLLFDAGADYEGGGENGRSAIDKCKTASQVYQLPDSCEILFQLIDEGR